MKLNQGQIDKLKEDIARVTRMLANPNRSSQVVEMLETRRQKYYMALKILSRN